MKNTITYLMMLMLISISLFSCKKETPERNGFEVPQPEVFVPDSDYYKLSVVIDPVEGNLQFTNVDIAVISTYGDTAWTVGWAEFNTGFSNQFDTLISRSSTNRIDVYPHTSGSVYVTYFLDNERIGNDIFWGGDGYVQEWFDFED